LHTTEPPRRVEVQFPDPLVNQYQAQQKNADRRDCIKVGLEIATVAGVFIYAGLTLWQGCTLRQTLDQTRIQASAAASQAQIAQTQLELSERPWLKVEAHIHGVIDFNKPTVYVPITWVVSNSGHSPATRASVIPTVADVFRKNPIEEQKRACQENYPWGVTTVFPNDSSSIEMYPSIEGGELTETKKLKTTQLYVTGCVSYLFGNRVYKTPFMYYIGRADVRTKKVIASWIEPKGIVVDGTLISGDLPSIPLE